MLSRIEMLPGYIASQCVDIIQWCQKHPMLTLEESDEISFFRFYYLNYQDRTAQKCFHTYKEDMKMQAFLAKIDKPAVEAYDELEIFLEMNEPPQAGYMSHEEIPSREDESTNEQASSPF